MARPESELRTGVVAMEARPRRSLPAALAGAVTGIGSLPYLAPDDAVRTVAAICPDVPFWPQLPRISEREGVIGQGLGVLAGLVEPRSGGYGYQVKAGKIDSAVEALHNSRGCLPVENAAGFRAFEAALQRKMFSSARTVKGQIEGPITLSTYLFYRDRPFLADASLFAAVGFHIAQMVCWQIDRLKGFGHPALIFIDEPALCLDNAGPMTISQDRRLSALAAIFEDIRARGAFGGLHCCADRPFERMCAVGPDILSFDAYQGLEQFFSMQHAADFVNGGGWVAYGMIPTSADLHSVESASIFGRWLACAAMAGDPRVLAQRAMVTATCGLGLLDESLVPLSFQRAHEFGKLLRQLAGLESAP